MRAPLKVYGIAVARSPQRERGKVMQVEKGTKLLKRIWKAIVYIELVIVTGALLFFSQYFSWDAFVSHVSQQATAATSGHPR
jgi:hypothetical protein